MEIRDLSVVARRLAYCPPRGRAARTERFIASTCFLAPLRLRRASRVGGFESPLRDSVVGLECRAV